MTNLFAVAALTLVVACRETAKAPLEAVIPGVYVCNFIDDKQVVKVLPDGTFQEIVGDGAGAKTFSGNWSVVKVRASEKLSIIFSSYHFENKTNLPGAGEVGDWLTIVRQGNNRVWLVVSDGDGLRCSRGVN